MTTRRTTTRTEGTDVMPPDQVGAVVADARPPDAQRKQEGLYILSNIAEREGRMAAAIELAKWADAIADFVPYPETPRRARTSGPK